MKEMISNIDVAVLDLNSSALGVDAGSLMESAGRATAEEAVERYSPSASVVIAGAGNNGGDALVAARYLHETGSSVTVVLLTAPEGLRTDITKKALASLPGAIKALVLGRDIDGKGLEALIADGDLVIDGILGTGASGRPRGQYLDAIRAIGRSKVPVVSVDVPSGLGTKDCVQASTTVTFHDLKENMLENGRPLKCCGEIAVRDIGIPDGASLMVGPGDMLRYPLKGKMARKGEGGKVLIIGGGPYTGAPTLAAMGALKAGADLVRVAVPSGIWSVVAGHSPDLIVERLATNDPFELGPEVEEGAAELLDWADAVLIGPGAGPSKPASELMVSLYRRCLESGKKVVVDADGIGALAKEWKRKVDKGKGCPLFTPHRGELKKMLQGASIAHFEDAVREPFADSGRELWKEEALQFVIKLLRKVEVDLLIKGPVDLIASLSRPSMGEMVGYGEMFRRYNTTGVPAMSTGGTGDVLSGLSAGLIARGMDTFDAACLASYVNGKAGERTFQELGHSMTASDMLKNIKVALP